MITDEVEHDLAYYKDVTESLREVTATQCSDGNWNYSSYMHGVANGMILALSMLDGVAPEYLEAPTQWLCDMPLVDPLTGQD